MPKERIQTQGGVSPENFRQLSDNHLIGGAKRVATIIAGDSAICLEHYARMPRLTVKEETILGEKISIGKYFAERKSKGNSLSPKEEELIDRGRVAKKELILRSLCLIDGLAKQLVTDPGNNLSQEEWHSISLEVLVEAAEDFKGADGRYNLRSALQKKLMSMSRGEKNKAAKPQPIVYGQRFLVEASNPVEIVERDQDKEKFLALIEKAGLTNLERDYLTFVFFHGFSYKRMAEELEGKVSIKDIALARSRAFRKIRVVATRTGFLGKTIDLNAALNDIALTVFEKDISHDQAAGFD